MDLYIQSLVCSIKVLITARFFLKNIYENTVSSGRHILSLKPLTSEMLKQQRQWMNLSYEWI